MWAPGERIYSTTTSSAGAATYAYSQGTSVAAPLVAGAAGLLRAHVPTASPSRVIHAITSPAQGTLARLSTNNALRRVVTNVDLPSGTFARVVNTSAVYFVEDTGVKRRVSSAALRSWGGSSTQVAVVKPEVLSRYRTSGRLGLRPGTLVQRRGTSDVYVVTNEGPDKWRNGTKRLVPPAALICLGYKTERVVEIEKSEIDAHPTGPVVGCDRHPNGTLIRRPDPLSGVDSLEVLDGNERRKFQTAQLIGSYGYAPDAVTPVPGDLLLPEGDPMGFRPGRVLRYANRVWIVTASGSDFARAPIRPFATSATVTCLGLSKAPKLSATTAEGKLHTQGSTLTC